MVLYYPLLQRSLSCTVYSTCSLQAFGTYAMAIAVAVLSAFVLSGAPGGGLVGEMLIVSLFGFPGEAFPLIATIGS